MFAYASFAMRNPTHVTKHWRDQWATRKALLAHRKENPVCALTGSTKNLQVHHIIPVSIDPTLAADSSNLITLTRDVHFVVAHGGNWKNFNPDIILSIQMLQAFTVVTKAHDDNHSDL